MTDYGSPQQPSDFSALFDLSFKRFVTISVVKVVYVIGIALIALFWIIGVISGFTQGVLQGLGAMILATVFAALGLLFWRIYLEIIVVVFRIADNTSAMARQLGGEPTGGFPVGTPTTPPPGSPPPPQV